MNRRSFLANLGSASAGLAIASFGLELRSRIIAQAGSAARLKAFGYGELFPIAAKNTGEVYLALTKGFEYNVIGKAGTIMSDGRRTPSQHDGMHAFRVGRELRLVRNHEVANRNLPVAGAGIARGSSYDETCGGGTVTLVVDPRTNTLVRDFVSLSGTHINCAGGATPWGSWISCEETTLGRTVRMLPGGLKRGGFDKPHGYCFEVPAAANEPVQPVPLKAMGRFVHEAVAVDKDSGVVYETEDILTAGFYRFIPRKKKRLAEGGTLQMLAVTGKPGFDTRRGVSAGAAFDAEWVTIDRPDPEETDVDNSAVYKQGIAKGAATFDRLEGCEIDRRGRVYFASTSGGDSRAGQIWRYEPRTRDRGRLTLLFESSDEGLLYMPDNICLMPKSELLFICEDSNYAGLSRANHVRVLTPNGKMADVARNISKDGPLSELAGTTFSPDGRTLFVNQYQPGATLAIWGPWADFRE